MACVSVDGTISASAKVLIKSLGSPLSAEEIAAKLGSPLFKVRSSLRELIAAGLVEARGEKYISTEEGRKRAATD